VLWPQPAIPPIAIAMMPAARPTAVARIGLSLPSDFGALPCAERPVLFRDIADSDMSRDIADT